MALGSQYVVQVEEVLAELVHRQAEDRVRTKRRHRHLQV
jgi:hypothetical protein